MRDGWREMTFGDALREIHRPVLVADLDIVRYAGVRWYAEGVYPRDPVPASEVKTKSLTKLRTGDVTYNRMWATKASFGLAHEDVDGCHVTNDFPIFEVDTAGTSGEYIELVFQTSAFQNEAATRATGTTERRRLKQRDFLNISVALPPLDEQRRIVDLIAAVDDAIDAAESEAEAAEASGKSIRRHQLDRDPTWEEVSIGDVARVVTGRSFKAEHQGRTSGVVPYFRVSDMTSPGNERELLIPNDWLDEAGVTSVKPVVCPPGTVVFPILGAALATEKRRVLGVSAGFVQHMIGLVPGPRVLSGFLLQIMQEVTLADLSQHGAMPSVNQKLVSGIKFMLPPLDVQQQIVDLGNEVDGVTDTARTTADSLKTLRSNLLTVLLSGEHEIPATYDQLLNLDDAAGSAAA